MFQEIENAFVLNPYEALQALAGTAIDRETTEKLYYNVPEVAKFVVPNSVRCISPAGLADTTAAREFASVRALCQKKRATVNPEAPDSALWGELVRQPTRVLRIVWSFASLRKVPLSAYSLAALEEENDIMGATGAQTLPDSSEATKKDEDCPFVAFSKALLEDSKKSREILAIKKKKEANRKARAKKKQEKKGGDGGSGGRQGGGGGLEIEREPTIRLDPSELSFDFSAVPLAEDPHTGYVHAILTVRLAPGAFAVSHCKDRIRVLEKQKDLREWTSPAVAWWKQAKNKTEDIWQERSQNLISMVLSKAFPERWGVDDSSPVVSVKKSYEDTTQGQLLPNRILRAFLHFF
jgi:hypothetical protein